MERIMVMLAACVLAASAGAQPIYKCIAGGKVSYGEHPCAHGRASAIRVAPTDGAAAAAAATAAAARLARDQERLAQRAQLEKEHQARALAEGRERERAARAAASARQKCERLRLKARWLEEDLARAGREATSAARLKWQRQAEALAVECPA